MGEYVPVSGEHRAQYSGCRRDRKVLGLMLRIVTATMIEEHRRKWPRTCRLPQ